jgi:hypothetical protein
MTMAGKDNIKAEEYTHRPPEETHTDTRKLISTLDGVFSAFREQLRTEAPKPFTGGAKIAADTFNDIVAGLKFESRRPGAVTIDATRVSPTEVELEWQDFQGNADGYRVERCQGYNCHDLDEIARLPSTARSYRDTSLLEQVAYRYRVVAFDARGETPSNTVDVPGSVSVPSRRAANV